MEGSDTTLPMAASATAPAAPFRGKRRREAPPIFWFAPVLVLLLVVTLYPTVFVVWMSFQKTNYFDLQGFVGFANYVDVLTGSHFWELTTTSLLYLLGSLVFSIVFGIGAALVFNGVGRFGTAMRVLALFPWTLSMAVVGSIWLFMLNPSFGPVPYFVKSLGVSPGLMLGDPDTALPLMILVTSWWSFPYVMVLVAAAIQSIPADLYEAISIDGAAAVAKFRFITWPHILPTIGSAGLNLAIVYLTLVTLIIVLTGGGPLGATTTLSLEAFRGTIQAVDIGPTAVLSIVILVINVMLGAAYMRLTGRVSG
jgi:multiple sugar transport system permease protein